MSEEKQKDLTRLLEVAGNDANAYNQIMPLVYEELKKLARSKMARERPGLTLQATALVNEAYLRLVGSQDVSWQNRAHFFGAAAEAMRRILIDRARKYASMKHGGEFRRTEYAEENINGNDGFRPPLLFTSSYFDWTDANQRDWIKGLATRDCRQAQVK